MTACLGAQRSSRARAEDDIREAVFKYHMHRFGRGWKDMKVHFLSVNGEDPSKALMGRFRGHKPPVKPVSQSVYRDIARGVRDRKTGEKGVVFRADKITWRSKTKVEVEGSYFVDGRAASGSTNSVEMRNGRWVVAKAKRHWIA